MGVYLGCAVAFTLALLPKNILATTGDWTPCSDRDGSFSEQIFKLKSCSWCFKYLFPTRDVKLTGEHKHLLKHNFELHFPDISNSSTTSGLCSTLNHRDCERWRQCCHAGHECCKKQSKNGPTLTMTRSCSPTWDGFLCWNATLPGPKYQYCPDYVMEGVERPVGQAHANKMCLPDGTWKTYKGKAWTNYTTCLEYQAYLVGVYVNLGTNILSILLLVPAIIIFISYSMHSGSMMLTDEDDVGHVLC